MVGLGCFDFIIKPQYDPEYGVTYEPMTCINDDTMAERCKIKNAKKVIWSIKASADFNTKAATSLRAGFQNGSINLLKSDIDIEEDLKKIRGYKKFTPKEQALLKVPYVQTTLLVNELINLEHEIKNNNVRIFERTGMRKDRYSSVMMNFKICQDISVSNRPQKQKSKLVDKLPIVKAQRIRAV